MSQLRLTTPRLDLIPADADLARADATHDQTALARLLDARITSEWPPELARNALSTWAQNLEANPTHTGWWSWYFIFREPHVPERVLIGSGGFGGPPDTDNNLILGYSILPTFQRRGFATEAVSTLINWAFAQPRVDTIHAQTFPDHIASVAVLAKLGFQYRGQGDEPGAILFGLDRAEYRQKHTPSDR